MGFFFHGELSYIDSPSMSGCYLPLQVWAVCLHGRAAVSFIAKLKRFPGELNGPQQVKHFSQMEQTSFCSFLEKTNLLSGHRQLPLKQLLCLSEAAVALVNP